MGETHKPLSRRDLIRGGIAAAGGVVGAGILAQAEAQGVLAATEKPLSFADGKYQTFPRIVMAGDLTEGRILQEIDLGTLGPDVDTIFGIDFVGDIQTGALVIHKPAGEVKETRVVGIKRTSLETVQFAPALGGDRFDVYQMSRHGGDEALDAMARLHAAQSAREHQKVVYVADLGLWEQQWGKNEADFLRHIIRAQRPGLETFGIPKSDFVEPRRFGPR